MNQNKIFAIASIIILMALSTDVIVYSVIAEEFENIDSFNVHPQHRWNKTNETMFTGTVENSVFNITDTYSTFAKPADKETKFTRQLSKRDFKITGRLQTPDALDGTGRYFPDYPTVSGDMNVYLPLNNNFQDSTANNHDGVGTGVYWGFDSIFGDENPFDEVDPTRMASIDAVSSDYISLGDDDDFSFTTAGQDEAFSISFWTYIGADTGSEQVLVGKYDNGGGQHREYDFFLDSYVPKARLAHLTDSGNRVDVASTKTLAQNQWYFLSFTYNGNETHEGMKIFVNGIDTTTGGVETGTYTGMTNGNTHLELGRLQSGILYANARYNEFILWNQQLSSSEILSMYNNYRIEEEAHVSVEIGLEDWNDEDNYVSIDFHVTSTNVSDPCWVLYSYNDISDTVQETNFVNVTRNTFVSFEIDFDSLRSEISFEVEYDKVDIDDADQDYQDISLEIPAIFMSDIQNVFFKDYFHQNSTTTWQLDYIKAPYEEFQWKQDRSGDIEAWDDDDGFFITHNELGVIADLYDTGPAQQAIDTIVYKYVIPDLDSLSGVLYANVNASDLASVEGGDASIDLIVAPINGTTGELATDDMVKLRFGYNILYTEYYPGAAILQGSSEVEKVQRSYDNNTYSSQLECPFTVYMSASKEAQIQMNLGGEVFSYSFNFSMYSQEFVIYTVYRGHTTGSSPPSLRFSVGVSDFEPIYRDLFGFIPDLPDVNAAIGAVVKPIANIFIQVGRMLGSVFSVIGATLLVPLNLIIGSINTITGLVSGLPSAAATAFTGVIGAVGTAVDAVELAVDLVTDAVNAVTTAITALPDLIATALIDLFDSLETTVNNLADSFWASLILTITDVLEAVALGFGVIVTATMNFLISSIALIVSLIGAVTDLIWDTFVEPLFAGIGAFIDLAITGLQTVYSMCLLIFDLVTDFPYVFFFIITLVIFWGALSGSDDMIDYCMNWLRIAFKDVTMGAGVFGVKIPVPLAFIWGFSLIWGLVVDVTL